MVTVTSGNRQISQDRDLLLRETNHRCSNDLQLVVSLLRLQNRRASNPEVREILSDVVERVFILSHARRAMINQASLEAALRQVCEALQAQAEPHGILMSFQVNGDTLGLSSTQITSLALVVNELATNAIKHAFEEGKSGRIRIEVQRPSDECVTIIVDDDGLPFPESDGKGNGEGLGLDLVRRLTASIGGLVIAPPAGSKIFEIRVPISTAAP